MVKFQIVSRLIPVNFLFIFLLLFSALNTPATAAGPAEAASIVKIFSTSENSVEKRELLVSLKNFVPEAGEKAPQWVVDLLGNALKDKSPVVVAEAALQIGKFNVLEYNAALITLFKEAGNKFGASGYDRRVQYSIIPALGKIGNKEAKGLISNLLEKDNASAMGYFLLEAIRNSNDPAFLYDLKLYKNKMLNFVDIAKKRGDDPLLYSRKLAYIELVTEIDKALSKGGK